MPSAPNKRASEDKEVYCTYCGKPSSVGRRAMSVFCPHCKKRLILENHKIKTYHAVRELFTCGDVVVERKGHVVAPVRAENLTVKGKLQGRVVARGTVRVTKTGTLQGDVEAVSLKIDSGGCFKGFIRINPAGGNGAPE